MSKLFCSWCYNEIKNGEMFLSWEDGMLVHWRCSEYLRAHPECWPQSKEEAEECRPECCGPSCSCNFLDKKILNVCFDNVNEEGRWIVQVSFIWSGNLKDGIYKLDYPESSILYGYVTEYSLLEKPDVWYIGAFYSAERADILAEKVVQELLKRGWVWQ